MACFPSGRRLIALATWLVASCNPKPAQPPPPPAPTASVEPKVSEAPAAEDAGAVVAPPPPAPPADKDPRDALAQAKKDGKATLLVFCAQWVASCREVAHVLAESGVRKILDERFVVARIDATDEDDVATKERMKRYNVKGLPFMIVFDKKGKEVARENGYLDVTRTTKLLERAK